MPMTNSLSLAFGSEPGETGLKSSVIRCFEHVAIHDMHHLVPCPASTPCPRHLVACQLRAGLTQCAEQPAVPGMVV